jgi:hypothetical protein
VYIDYENFFTILKPGGVMAFDDIGTVPATKAAFGRMAEKYGLEQNHINRNQGYIQKPTGKY